jgi:nucleotide-binding universal stress UspA family protein
MPDAATAPARLLIAYDGSDGAAGAIRAAGQLFPGARATVAYVRGEPAALEHAALARIALPDVVLVASANEYERQAEQHARDIAERGRMIADRAGLEATADVLSEPSAWRALCHAAAGEHADLIVCGSRGQGPFSRALLGSTSSSLLHHAEVPVLVVPPGVGDLSGPMIIGYDGSDGAQATITAAARLLPTRPAVVVHVWCSPIQRSFASASLLAVPLDEVNDTAQDLDDLFAAQAQDTAEEGAMLAREQGLVALSRAVESAPGAWRGLSAAGRAEGAAVIVTGCRGRGALGSTVLGSVSAGLVHNAELPVLIVRGHDA